MNDISTANIENLEYRIKQLEKVLHDVGDSIKQSSLSEKEKQEIIWKLQAGIFIDE